MDYYDGLLAVIPTAIALGALASVHGAVAVHEGLAGGSLFASLVLVELLFRNPPTEPTRPGTVGTAMTGIGWVLTAAAYL